MPPEPGDTSGDNWKNEIPEDYRKSTLISETKSVADLAKFAVETQQMLGTAIRIPSEHASDADREAFQKRLTEIGMVPKATFREVVRPKDPGDYKYENGVDEKLGITQTEMDVWKLEAHSLGLSSEQFNDYAGQQVKAREVALDAQQAAFNTADTALKDEWGGSAEVYYPTTDGAHNDAIGAVPAAFGLGYAFMSVNQPQPEVAQYVGYGIRVPIGRLYVPGPTGVPEAEVVAVNISVETNYQDVTWRWIEVDETEYNDLPLATSGNVLATQSLTIETIFEKQVAIDINFNGYTYFRTDLGDPNVNPLPPTPPQPDEFFITVWATHLARSNWHRARWAQTSWTYN